MLIINRQSRVLKNENPVEDHVIPGAAQKQKNINRKKNFNSK